MGAAAELNLDQFFREKIAQRQLELPVLPGVAAEIVSLCSDEDTDAAMLSKVIHRDQTLAGSVLRVANSSAHAGQVPCASLQQAVSRLGLQIITEIALAVSLRSRAFQSKVYGDMLNKLWRHALLAGLFTKEIARMRRQNVEIAFLAGLLHDIGKTVLLSNLDRAHGRAEAPMDELVTALQEHHTQAGGLLAAEWRLPEQIAEAIVLHHDFARATRYADLTMMVCLADLVAHGVAPSALEPDLGGTTIAEHPVVAGLNLYPDQLQELLQRTEKIVSVAEALG